MSPYSVSKAATEALCYQWSQTEMFSIITARPFTISGRVRVKDLQFPISPSTFGDIASKARPVIHVGDLDTSRDFTDVRDVVRAYKLLLGKGRNGHCYNVCSATRDEYAHATTRISRAVRDGSQN